MSHPIHGLPRGTCATCGVDELVEPRGDVTLRKPTHRGELGQSDAIAGDLEAAPDRGRGRRDFGLERRGAPRRRGRKGAAAS